MNTNLKTHLIWKFETPDVLSSISFGGVNYLVSYLGNGLNILDFNNCTGLRLFSSLVSREQGIMGMMRITQSIGSQRPNKLRSTLWISMQMWVVNTLPKWRRTWCLAKSRGIRVSKCKNVQKGSQGLNPCQPNVHIGPADRSRHGFIDGIRNINIQLTGLPRLESPWRTGGAQCSR